METRHGRVAIEKIKVGDEVLARNMDTGKLEYKKVIALTKPHLDRLLELHIQGEREPLKPTPSHLFWAKRGGREASWVRASDLRIGDLLLTIEGQWRKVLSITSLNGQQDVYNFAVQDDHDYFVGAAGFLVHNSVCDYSQRVLDRMAETANDPFHNFPGSFDQEVVENGNITVITPSYVQYELAGEVNGTTGFYEVGGDWVDNVFVITHSFFNPL